MELTLERVINHVDLRSRHIYSVSLGIRRSAGVSRRKMQSTSKEMNPPNDEYQKMGRAALMKMRVERVLEEPDWNFRYNGYRVLLGDHRVLTFTTGCPIMATKWLKEILKTVNTKSRELIVGISVNEAREGWGLWHEKMVQICTGSHCLIFRLPPKEEIPYGSSRYGTRITPALKMMEQLLGTRKVSVVTNSTSTSSGILEMQGSLKFLSEDYGVLISNPVQVVSGTKLGQKAKEIGIREEWPIAASKAPWYEDMGCWGHYWPPRAVPVPVPVQFTDDMLTDDKVLFCALKTYLCFLIGNDNLHPIKPHHSPSTTKKKN
ncbi:hypothetical protein LguiB_003840 [Lonicera macranthoides]